MRAAPIPVFDLYGEQSAKLPLDPVHIETIRARSRLHDWIIRPHRHGALHQVFWIRRGGGELTLENETRCFAAPFLFVVPPGTVHGFHFREGTQGHVLTLTAGFLAGQQAVLGPRGRLERISELDGRMLHRGQRRLAQAFRHLHGVFGEASPAREVAGGPARLAGAVLEVLGLLEHALERGGAGSGLPPRPALLVARFRALVDVEFRARGTLPEQARRLGVSATQLTRACRQVTGRSPLELLQDRRMLEAMRLLAHTTLGIGEIAYASGFSDPAYFSRFFAKRAGRPPSSLRRPPDRPAPT
ncbi:helix-turn-helix domain-containing protein [Teichococcus oryzae]|uniref:Helix-turn-helix domain-containing protein n=1 Tax=Teichococcus oryzae TaxID=1608942 RepID=A0A5B2TCF4_9PROT|nr:helix-turn-helix domain-containing protein [Pseudoroseomonas oryzae]KAA2211755.1 helix-turn-helix domain-containing protein [Pseudoroseomonas oryzae]